MVCPSLTKPTKQKIMDTTYRIKLVLKGILFYATIIAVYFFMAGVDSIYDEGHFFTSVIVVAALVYACYKLLNKEEVNMFTLSKYFSMEEPAEEDDEW